MNFLPWHESRRFSPRDAGDASRVSQVDVTKGDVATFANTIRSFVGD